MKRERGAAMIWALFLVIATSGLTAAMLQRDVVLRRDATTDAQRLGALQAAEGALAQVRYALARGKSPAAGPLRIGCFTVTTALKSVEADRWRVDVVAQPGNGRIEATLHKRAGSVRLAGWRASR